jgi:hypothetical protein
VSGIHEIVAEPRVMLLIHLNSASSSLFSAISETVLASAFHFPPHALRRHTPEQHFMNKKYIGVGISLGLCFGAALGAAMQNIGLGMALGVALGTAFGAGWPARRA